MKLSRKSPLRSCPRISSSIFHKAELVSLSCAISSASSGVASICSRKVRFTRSYSRRTCASLPGSEIFSSLISRMVSLSISSPGEISTTIVIGLSTLHQDGIAAPRPTPGSRWRTPPPADITRRKVRGNPGDRSVTMRAMLPYEAENPLKEEFFGHRTDGYFVEVGANDPEQWSQSLHLERLGWRGILIEPQPDLADRL